MKLVDKPIEITQDYIDGLERQLAEANAALKEESSPRNTAHHAWHSRGQFPETCTVCSREANARADRNQEAALETGRQLQGAKDEARWANAALVEAVKGLEEVYKTFNSIRVLAEQHAGLTAVCSCTQWDIVGEWCREELARIEALQQGSRP